MHFMKLKSGALSHMLQHYTREYCQEHIDNTKTKDNIYYDTNFKKCESNEMVKKINQAITDRVNKTVRKDAVKMIDLIITQPEYLGKNCDKVFFDKMNDFCQKEFGKENSIYSVVHLDESQPHLHFSFIPIKQNEKGENVLSAKDILTRNYLKQFHSRVEKKTGYTLTVGDGKIRDLTLQEYKKQKEIDKLNARLQDQEQTITDLTEQIEQQVKSKDFSKIRYRDLVLTRPKQEELKVPTTSKIFMDKENIKVNEQAFNQFLEQIKKQKEEYEKALKVNLAKLEIAKIKVDKGATEVNNQLKDYKDTKALNKELTNDNKKLTDNNKNLADTLKQVNQSLSDSTALIELYNDTIEYIDAIKKGFKDYFNAMQKETLAVIENKKNLGRER